MRYEIKDELTKVQTTFSEFVEKANSAPIKGYGSSEVEKRKSPFYGDARSFEEMYSRCYDGYNAKEVGKARADLNNLFNAEEPEEYKSFIGESIDMGSYSQGNPLCFYQEIEDYGKPKVHILLSTNAVGGVDAESFLNHGGAIASMADQIASQADVKISLYITNNGVFTGKGCQIVTLKDYEENIDIPRIGAVGHPSFFRRIGFRWFENGATLIDSKCRNGYGASMTGSNRHRVISDEEMYEWVRISNDEMVIDCPAPDERQFRDITDTFQWVKNSLQKIADAIAKGEQYVKLFD